MLEDLVYDWLLVLSDLDGDPLRDDDCDAAADDVVTWLLLACFWYQCIGQEEVEVDLVVEDICGKANSGVDGVFEEYVFVVRCWWMSASCYRNICKYSLATE